MDIHIRAGTKDDYNDLARIFEHPIVVEQSSQHLFLGYDRITKALDVSDIILVAEYKTQVAGYLGLKLNPKPREKHVASFGMAVHPDCFGKGIGKALLKETISLADNWLNIVRLELNVYTDNPRAIALYEKLGFMREGVAKMASFKNGQYVDLLNMARIAPTSKDNDLKPDT